MIQPREVDLQLMLTIASIGLFVNIILTFVLTRSTKEEENLNIKSALWHFLGDLLSSVGIIISAVIIYFTGWTILDALISMIIAGIIFTGGAKIIRESYLILMESVPENFDLDLIRRDIRQLEGVEDVHEMHLWAVTTDHYSLTAHVIIRDQSQTLATISTITHMLKEKYGLEHSTIQIEHPAIHHHEQYGRDSML